MRIRILLMLIIIAGAALAFSGCPVTGDCPGCKEMDEALQSSMFLSIDEPGNNITAYLYYENISAEPPRQPIPDSTIIVHVYNESFGDTYRIYTNETGSASFDFSSYNSSCVNFKFLYCPFTCDNSSQCGFLACLEYAGINCTLPSCNVSDISEASWAQRPDPLTCPNLLPALQTAHYCPPPPPLSQTPLICFPLILIFAILGGALFLSGKNPFAAFDLSAPRLGRHIRYQARARGVAVSAPTFVTQWVMSQAKGALAKGLGAAFGAAAKGISDAKGKGKEGKAVKEAIKDFAKGQATGSATTVFRPGQGISVAPGKGRKGRLPTMKDFIKGGPIMPWSKYTRGFEALGKLVTGETFREAGVNIEAINRMSKAGNISFETAKQQVIDRRNFAAFTDRLKKIIGPNFKARLSNVTKEGFVLGKNGKPLEITIAGKKAKIIIDTASAKVGVFSATIKFDDGNLVSIQPATKGKAPWEIKIMDASGKELIGPEATKISSGLNIDKIAGKVGENVSLTTTYYDKKLGQTATAEFKPLGDFKNYTLTTEKNVVIQVKDFKAASITGGTLPPELGIKVGTDMSGVLETVGSAHAANNELNAARQQTSNAYTVTSGEAFLNSQPGLKKQVTEYKNRVNDYVQNLEASDAAKNLLLSKSIDHVGIAKNADQAGMQALATNKQTAKTFAPAMKGYTQAILGGKMDPDAAFNKYIKPQITTPENFNIYRQAYNKAQGDAYANYGGADKSVRNELRKNAETIANNAAAANQTLPSYLRDKIGVIPVANLSHPEEPDERNKFNEKAMHELLGTRVVRPAADYYMKHRELPPDLPKAIRDKPPAAAIFYAHHAAQVAPQSSIQDSVNTDKLNRQYENVQHVTNYAGTLKGTDKDRFFFEATYNLATAGKKASAQLEKLEQQKSETKPAAKPKAGKPGSSK